MSDKKKGFKIKAHFGKVSAILIAVFAVLLTVDLVLKHCEEAYAWDFDVIPRLINVSYGMHNEGAAFSFLSDTEWGRIFFIVLTFIMLAVMVFAFVILPERFIILKLAIVMIASGALGNLVDRLAFGYVRDFVWVNIFGSWACCNFADFWIVFGVILAVLDIMFLNEWAVFPLTKKARAAAKLREAEEKGGNAAVEDLPQGSEVEDLPQNNELAEDNPNEEDGETQDEQDKNSEE